MKKIISIVLLLVCVLTASAQIQRNFLGFTLGVTTKTQVYNYLKNHCYKFSKDDLDDGYKVENISFGGYQWTVAFITFHKNKLCSIEFYDSDDFRPQEFLEGSYKNLSTSLDKKYHFYLSEQSPNSKHYSDGVVKCVLAYSYAMNAMMLSLSYYYMPLLRQKGIDEASEL